MENMRNKALPLRAWFHTALDEPRAFFLDFKHERIKVLFVLRIWLCYQTQGESSDAF